jgi:hypothetical protein
VWRLAGEAFRTWKRRLCPLGGSTGLEIVYIYCTYLYHCIILHSQWVVDLITRILGRLLNAQSVLTFQKKKKLCLLLLI